MVFVVYCRVREEQSLGWSVHLCFHVLSLLRRSLGQVLSTVLMWKQVSDKPREVEDTVLCDRDARNSEWLLSRERQEEGEMDRSLDWSAKAS